MILVEHAAFALVVTAGCRGHMHEGVPWGGPLIPELFVRANRLAGNADDAAAIEVHLSLTVRAQSEVTVSTEREVIHLASGDTFSVTPGPSLRARYLAIHGGVTIDTLEAVPLQKGETLVAGTSLGHGEPLDWAAVGDEVVRVIPGPDEDAFPEGTLGRLQPFRIDGQSNRLGTRLSGATIPRPDGFMRRSGPMVVGAIQVPGDGSPIVLGPDHPTTGGYPVIAVIATSDLGRFHARPIGSTVRFRDEE